MEIIQTSDFNYELNQIRAQQKQRKFEEEQDLLEIGEENSYENLEQMLDDGFVMLEEIDNLRDHYMATKLHQLMEQHQQILVIMGLETLGNHSIHS